VLNQNQKQEQSNAVTTKQNIQAAPNGADLPEIPTATPAQEKVSRKKFTDGNRNKSGHRNDIGIS
jgi:hypothetical protein